MEGKGSRRVDFRGFVKVEGMIEERSSSSIMPQAAKWHLPRSLWIYKFFIKAQGKALELFSFGKKND